MVSFDLFKPYRLRPRRLMNAAILALVVTGLVLGAVWLGWLDVPEMKLLDWRFCARGQRSMPRDVLIVALDDKTMNRARRLSPVPRDLLADIVRRLADAGAKTIVLDVDLRETRSDEEDKKLQNALADAGNVILAAVLDEQEQLARPHSDFEDIGLNVGLSHVERTDADHIVRWHKPVEDGMPSLALAAYAHFTDRDINDFLRNPLVTGDWSLDTDGRMLIDFAGPPGSFPRVSAATVLDGTLPPNRVRGKLILIGGTWRQAGDLHFVPFGHWLADVDVRLMTGVEVQAHCVATLLERRPLRIAPLWVNALLLFVVVFVVALVMVCFPPTAAALLSVALGALYVWLGLHLFVKEHLVVRLAPPLTGIVIAYFASALVTERRARQLRQHFRRYVGREVADQIAEMNDAEIGRMGKERVVTILFADMRGYNEFSRTRPPEEVVDFLNRYFDRLTAAIHAHNGFVDKLMGDGLMAVFGMFPVVETGRGRPYPSNDQRREDQRRLRRAETGRGRPYPSDNTGAHDAARAALAMRDAIEDLRTMDDNFKSLSVGIGIHTGAVIVGEIATPHKADFTAVGSAVNLASRIEGEARRVFHERDQSPSVIILISHATHALIADTVEATFLGAMREGGEEVGVWELGEAK